MDRRLSRGRLVLVGTPLGNREDLSPRARRTLLEADLLLCEDTRSPVRLLGESRGLPPRLSCFTGNEASRVGRLLEALAAGETVAYVSEAGLPLWSDPGERLVAAAVAAGYDVDVVPGPTAAATALCLSGMPAKGARFVGFLPRRGAARREDLAEIAGSAGASVIYEAGNRVSALLADLVRVIPDAATRDVVIGRELTKRHQEILRGSLSMLSSALTESLRGEVTLVVAAAPERPGDDATVAARATLDAMLEPDLRPRERARRLAELTGLDANVIYARLHSNPD
ncbi:MAG: 16S rRNA (cytidine(1402)-2'-O)-methyltransferase [Nannocystaceae bacterium]